MDPFTQCIELDAILFTAVLENKVNFTCMRYGLSLDYANDRARHLARGSESYLDRVVGRAYEIEAGDPVDVEAVKAFVEEDIRK